MYNFDLDPHLTLILLQKIGCKPEKNQKNPKETKTLLVLLYRLQHKCCKCCNYWSLPIINSCICIIMFLWMIIRNSMKLSEETWETTQANIYIKHVLLHGKNTSPVWERRKRRRNKYTYSFIKMKAWDRSKTNHGSKVM